METELTYQVHAVASGSDQTGVTDGIQRSELFKGDGAVHEVDRHELDGAEATVDSSHQLVDVRAQVLILLDILTRGHGDLHQYYLANPLGMLVEEYLHGVQLLRNSLDVIETINADDNFDAFETTAESGDTVDDTLTLKALFQRGSAKSETVYAEVSLTSRNCEGSMPIGNVPTVA